MYVCVCVGGGGSVLHYLPSIFDFFAHPHHLHCRPNGDVSDNIMLEQTSAPCGADAPWEQNHGVSFARAVALLSYRTEGAAKKYKDMWNGRVFKTETVRYFAGRGRHVSFRSLALSVYLSFKILRPTKMFLDRRCHGLSLRKIGDINAKARQWYPSSNYH